MKTFLIIAALAVTAACTKQADPEPTVQSKLPFDEFYLSNKFGSSAQDPQNPYHFTTWATLQPNAAGAQIYSYYTSEPLQNPTIGCTKTITNTLTMTTFLITCDLPRVGTVNPNNATWPARLQYNLTIEMQKGASPKINLGKISFTGVGEEIDFTTLATVKNETINGYNCLTIGGKFDVQTSDKKALHMEVSIRQQIN